VSPSRCSCATIAGIGAADLVGLVQHIGRGQVEQVSVQIVGVVGRAPDRVQRGFAGALDATTPVFHKVNYWGSCAGAKMPGPARADVWLGRVIASLQRHLDRETVHTLLRTMRRPLRWGLYFAEQMSLAEVSHYAAVHFDHHRRQLTLGDESAER